MHPSAQVVRLLLSGGLRSAIQAADTPRPSGLSPSPMVSCAMWTGLASCRVKGTVPHKTAPGDALAPARQCSQAGLTASAPDRSPAPTWVQDRLDDVPIAPLSLHALQLLGLVALAALLLLLLPGVLWGRAGWENGRGSGLAPRSPPPVCPAFLKLELCLSLTIHTRYK